MSKQFNDAALRAVLSPGKPPANFDRAGRIKLIGQAGTALLRGELPERAACMFLGGALLAWLSEGGNLERDFLKVIVNGSHMTPARVWQFLRDAPLEGGQEQESQDTVAPTSTERE